ncbi:hypothetical protein Rsub_00424 [Raphidocelis subcapitata]|uniref:Uncharacterized protein n=1 Tax=Raphidocelis subcapitata TaxID=307507 RepID=A0A2V0NQ98_9CHLO|nr:hypothetical protein Rsub_00424 [Raphidocelis subcapitata]|eukprot:GBF87713.1 hypothetical protein Rsub_00424 [Raphidocelis subcapitata]
MASRELGAAAALLERLATSALHKGRDPGAAAALEQLCQGVAAANRLAADACPELDQWFQGGGAGATAAARTQAAVEAALRHASEALSARLSGGGGGSNDDGACSSSRVDVAAQLLRLAAEGAGQRAWVEGARPDECAAALAALECLSSEDLGSLPRDAFSAALLLQPALLDRLTEGVARAACGSDAPASEALRGRAEWRHVPAVLAEQPALLQRFTLTLLSWWQLSGHPRLWLLLSATCRPAWQLLLPAAEGGGEAAATQLQPPNHHQQQEQQQQQHLGPLPWEGVRLLCCAGAPLGLARLLLATPTRATLRQLLAALPGRGDGGDSSGGGGGGAERSPCRSPSGADNNAWPSEDEWCLSWGGAQPARQSWEGAAEQQPQQRQRDEVTAAWRLAMQHRCWYEYAVWLLAHSSLRVLLLAPPAQLLAGASKEQQPATQQQQQQQQQQAPPGTQQPQGGRQQQGAAAGSGGRDDALKDAALAAEFVAWMVAPARAERQHALCQQFLGCIDAAAGTTAASATAAAVTTDAVASPSPAAAAVNALLAAWRGASGGSGSGAGGGVRWPWWLAGVDLPAALLQHPSVLLSGHGPMLLTAAAAPQPPRGGGSGGSSGGGGAVQGSGAQLLEQTALGGARDALEALSAAVLELLQPAAAVAPPGGGGSGAGSGGASAGAAAAPSQHPGRPPQPQHHSAGGDGRGAPAARGSRARRSWLAGCVRHVLTSGGLPLGEGSSQPQQAQAQGQGQAAAQRLLVLRLRQLLAAVQACQDVLTTH